MNDITISFLLDKSGSMQSIWDDTIGGFNAFKAQQAAEPGKALFGLTLFDNGIHVAHPPVPIVEVADLNRTTYVPGGGTALYDAMGAAIGAAQSVEIAGVPLVVVLTDGQENASRSFTRASLAALIAAKKQSGWQFLYLGTSLENWADAEALGAQPVAFAPTPAGTAAAFADISARTTAARRR
jgi:hypothetical protein